MSRPALTDSQDFDAHRRRRAVFAAVVGNMLEWFDFGIFSIFAVIISRLFFPGHDSTTQLLVATATIGVAFLARPVGGVLFGIYADHKGRKPAMSLIILIMTVGTGMVAVLPTYASIGIAAPVLLVLARLLQGASAGGEFSSATSMLVEFAPDGQRGYLGSFQMVSQSLAFALGKH